MHTLPQVHIPDPVDYPAPRKFVLVLSCVDCRLLDDLVRFLEHDNLTNRYYHVALAGTSLALTERWKQDTDKDPAHFSMWRQTFIENLKAAIALTRGDLSDIYIVQHQDCGAFRVYVNKDAGKMSDSEELHLHADYAAALMQDIVENFYSVYCPKVSAESEEYVQKTIPAVHSFFMDLRGGIRHIESWPGKRPNFDRSAPPMTERTPDATASAPTQTNRRRKKPARG